MIGLRPWNAVGMQRKLKMVRNIRCERKSGQNSLVEAVTKDVSSIENNETIIQERLFIRILSITRIDLGS